MRNVFSSDQPAVYLQATFRPYITPSGPMPSEQRLRLAGYCDELTPYAEVLCGNVAIVGTAMTHAFEEATKRLWSVTSPLNLRVGFKRILIDSCLGLRQQIAA